MVREFPRLVSSALFYAGRGRWSQRLPRFAGNGRLFLSFCFGFLHSLAAFGMVSVSTILVLICVQFGLTCSNWDDSNGTSRLRQDSIAYPKGSTLSCAFCLVSSGLVYPLTNMRLVLSQKMLSRSLTMGVTTEILLSDLVVRGFWSFTLLRKDEEPYDICKLYRYVQALWAYGCVSHLNYVYCRHCFRSGDKENIFLG